MLSNSLVPLSRIVCNSSNQFDPLILQQAAKLVMNCGGVVLNPLILRQIDIGHYELVNGVFEYFTALEAKKLDSIQCESINAYVVEPEIEPAIMEQIKLFRSVNPLNPNGKSMQEEQLTQLERLVSVLDRTESKLDKLEQNLGTKLSAIETKIQSLQKTSSTEATPKESVTRTTTRTTTVKLDSPTLTETSSDTETSTDGDKFLEFINRASLKDLKDVGADLLDSHLSAIIKHKKKNGEFESRSKFEEWVEKGRNFRQPQYNELLAKWNEKNAASSNDNSDSQAQQPSPPLQQQLLGNAEEVPMASQVSNEVTAIPASDDTSESVKPKSRSRPPKNKAARGIDRLNNMNQVELAQILHRLKLSNKHIEAILEQRPFASFDTMNISGLGPKTKKLQSIREEFEK